MKKIMALVLALVLVLMCGAALAEWPERSIELIVPANPGGDTDANARALAAALNQEFGWDVVVSNMSGGSGAVAFDNLRENPDNGYRYVFYHSGGTIAQLMGMYDYSLTDDFCTVGMPFMDYSSAFLSNSSNEKFNDIESLVAYMKEHPGEVTFATETGNFTHLHALAFQEAAGVEFKIVDAGTAANIIPDTAVLEGTIRANDKDARATLVRRIREVACATAAAYGATAEVTSLSDVPPLVCDPELTREMVGYMQETGIPGLRPYPGIQASASEDFATIAEQVPSTFMYLSAGFTDERGQYSAHNPKVRFNEDVTAIGPACLAHCAVRWLAEHQA